MKTTTKYFKVYKATGKPYETLSQEKALQLIKVTFNGSNGTDKRLSTATVTTPDGKSKEILSASITATNQKGVRLYRPAENINELAAVKRLPPKWALIEYNPTVLPPTKPAFHVCICGSREWKDYSTLADFCDKTLAEKAKTHDIIIHSGKARGADTLGEQYAKKHNYKIVEHPALWDTEGNAAGYNRNERMLKAVDAVIAFPLEKSPGTAHMINSTKKAKKPIRICTAYLPVKK